MIFNNNVDSSARKRRFLTTTALSLGLFATPNVALAQDEAETADATQRLGVVSVTARQREESLQEVPVTVTSIGGDVLEVFNVTNVDKLESRVPSLRIQQGGPNGGATLSLRGINTANLSPAFESAVALDFDGVSIGQLRILQAGFFDIEQIDVLKGPQSLFFGKSASAGVMSLRSAGSTDTFEAGGSVGYEFEEEGSYIEGYVSGPITETLGARLAARFAQTEKLVENTFPGVANPERGSEDTYIRGTLEWSPTDTFTAEGKLTYLGHERDGASMFADIDCGENGVADGVFLFSGGLILPAGYDCNVGDGQYTYADPAAALLANAGLGFNDPVPFHETDIWLGRFRMDYDLTDQLTFTSITGYYGMDVRELEAFSYGGILGVDGNGVPINGGTGMSAAIFETDQWSQEFRLTSDTGGAFDFTLGAFFEMRENIADTPQYAANIGLSAADPITGFTSDWIKLQDTDSEAYSIFASFDWRVSDRVDVAGGLRYTEEEKESVISVPYTHLFLTGPFVPSGFETQPIKFDDDNLSPELSISYAVTDTVNLFAAYKTGFKSGGVDSAVLPAASLAAADAASDFSSIIFESEESEGFEVGVKSDLFDGTLRLNATAYSYTFENLQIQQFDPVAIQFATLNAGEITTEGVDVDFTWLTEVDGLTFSGSLALLNSEFSDTFIPVSDDLNGRAARYAPDFAGNVSVDYRVPVGGLELGFNGNMAYSDEYFIADESLTDIIQDAYTTFDAAISLGSPDDSWRVTLSAVNIGDELWRTSSTGRPFLQPGVGDDRVVSFNRGRQVFLEAAFKY